MRYFSFFFIFISFLISCDYDVVSSSASNVVDDDEDQEQSCDCNIDKEPIDYDVTLKLTFNEQNKKIPIFIYKNNIEMGSLEKSDTAVSSTHSINLRIGHNYTAVAKYLSGKDTVMVPVNFTLKKESYECDGTTCWNVKNDIINLKLKN